MAQPKSPQWRWNPTSDYYATNHTNDSETSREMRLSECYDAAWFVTPGTPYFQRNTGCPSVAAYFGPSDDGSPRNSALQGARLLLEPVFYTNGGCVHCVRQLREGPKPERKRFPTISGPVDWERELLRGAPRLAHCPEIGPVWVSPFRTPTHYLPQRLAPENPPTWESCESGSETAENDGERTSRPPWTPPSAAAKTRSGGKHQARRHGYRGTAEAIYTKDGMSLRFEPVQQPRPIRERFAKDHSPIQSRPTSLVRFLASTILTGQRI